jgi:hypothetical protein
MTDAELRAQYDRIYDLQKFEADYWGYRADLVGTLPTLYGMVEV